MKKSILIIYSFAAIYVGVRLTPIYGVGNCAEDQIFGDPRKVMEVREVVYKYRVYDKIRKKYFEGFMRIRDFDRIMKPIECPEEL